MSLVLLQLHPLDAKTWERGSLKLLGPNFLSSSLDPDSDALYLEVEADSFTVISRVDSSLYPQHMCVCRYHNTCI
jgi:hypothetical protein